MTRTAEVASELSSASDDQIIEALGYADPLVLRGVLYHLTGDESLAEMPHVIGPGMLGKSPYLANESDVALLRKKAFDLLAAYRDGILHPPAEVSRERLLRAMSMVVCQEVPPEGAGFWLQELAIDQQAVSVLGDSPEGPHNSEMHVVVVGAGLAGVNAAIQLKTAGISFEVFEKAAGVGGTWQQNRYPGARVDFPSRMYSYAFSMKYPFEHLFAPQAENEKYLNWCVDEFGVRDQIHLNTEVVAMRWNEDDGWWDLRVRHADGSESSHRARALISAVGFLDRPAIPKIDGLDSFAGKVMHTGRFDTEMDWAGRRVAVVGTGASGMQLVPDLAPKVGALTVFQRSPGWVLPVPGYRDLLPEPARWLNRNLPYLNNWTRFVFSWHMGDPVIYDCWSVDPEWTDPDTLNADNFDLRERLVAYLEEKLSERPDLIKKCLPTYPPLSKRFVVDNGWFDALKRDNVELVTDGIARFEPDGIITDTGQKVELDTVVFATGFRANEYFWPMEITGRDGVTPAEIWAEDGARAYWGVTVPNLPNFFVLYGPNTNPKNGGPIAWGGSQIRHALQVIQQIEKDDLHSVEIGAPAFESFNHELDERMSTTIWMDPRQTSYYRNEYGRSATNAPWSTIEYWRQLREVHWEDYVVTRKEA